MNNRFFIAVCFVALLALAGVFAADTLPAGNGRLKLLVVEVHADWCPRCHRVTPVFRELRKDYAMSKKISFVVLDVTDKKSKIQAATQAEALGIGGWFEQNKARTSTVAIFRMPSKKLVNTFANQADKQVYVTAITEAFKK